MTRSIKTAMAAIALTSAAGFAIAQGNPPTTGTANPATGAGQQTQQNTPMGTTGTPAANQGTGSGTMSGSTGGTTTNQSTATQGTGGTQDTTRMARADRN